MYIPILSYVKKRTRKQQERVKMANTKQKRDRWSSAEKPVLYITQPSKSRTPTIDLSATLTMSTNNNDQ